MPPTAFLDIDGVIQPHPTIEQLLRKPKYVRNIHKEMAEKMHWPGIEDLGEEDVNRILNCFSKEAMGFLKALHQEYGLRYVITSSWTLCYTLEMFQSIFALYGMGDAISDTILSSLPRSQYIRDYIREHDVKNWIVIDDMNMQDIFGERQIVVEDHFGPADYIHARKLLEEPL